MSKFEDNMENIFDIEVSSEKTEIVAPEESQDADKDYEYTRGELYRLISKGQEG